MTTADTIIARLPNTPTVTPIDIASACGLKSANSIINAVQAGKLSAIKIGMRYIISRENAEAFIRAASEEGAK